jgi:nitroreductase
MAAQDLIDFIAARQSPGRLDAPAPGEEALGRALSAAIAAPDHKRLQPWKFIVIEKERRAQFGDLMAESLKSRTPEADAQQLERERAKATRAPMIIVVAACINREAAGVPEIEQVLSAGVATQNLILALHAQGFGAAWKTGDAAYSPLVKQRLGLRPDDHIVAILYVGTPALKAPARTRAPYGNFLVRW